MTMMKPLSEAAAALYAKAACMVPPDPDKAKEVVARYIIRLKRESLVMQLVIAEKMEKSEGIISVIRDIRQELHDLDEDERAVMRGETPGWLA